MGRAARPASRRRHHRGLDHLRDRGRRRGLHAGPAPSRSAVLEQHADRRRHGCSRLGARVPARPPLAALPPLGVGARLVRRLPRLPVLHGDTCAGSGHPRRRPALRARAQARVDRGSAHTARGRVGLRQAQRAALPGAPDVRGDRGRLPLRRDVHDLRRQHRVDDGGRVLVLDRAVALARLLRRTGPRAAHRPTPRARGGVARTVRPVAPHRRDLRRGRHDRVVPPLPGSPPLQVARDDTSGRGVAHRVLGRAVLDAASLPHRHGVRATHRLREPALPGHVEVGRHSRRARRDRLARRDRAPTADRHLARADDAHLRRLDHRVAAEHVLERAADALLLPVQVPPRRPRCGGDRALAGVDRVAPVRSRRQARCDRAHPGRRCARLCDRARHEPAHPARRAHGDGAEVVRTGLRVQLVRPHQHEIGVRRRLGEVELPRLRGQARVRRVPRRDDDHGRDRPDARAAGARSGSTTPSSTSTARRCR